MCVVWCGWCGVGGVCVNTVVFGTPVYEINNHELYSEYNQLFVAHVYQLLAHRITVEKNALLMRYNKTPLADLR